MAAPAVRPSIVKYLYTHNPFYAISAVLMLYAIRTAYERLGIEASNCWLMTGALAGYTLVLAVIGVWIVRWGKVWEDARSILLMLLVLFLAVSISADDLFVKVETSSTAIVERCASIRPSTSDQSPRRASRSRSTTSIPPQLRAQD